MAFVAVNPATGQTIARYAAWDESRLTSALDRAAAAQRHWRETSLAVRAGLVRELAVLLRAERDRLASRITEEMGKLAAEARAEVEKCATCCDYYAQHGPDFLSDEEVATDAHESFVTFEPLGVVLAIMPWNFPFWQVFRAAVPAVLAGNAVVLKHASNVPGCAVEVENLFRRAGFPAGVFTTLMVGAEAVERIIASPHVAAVTLTGSEAAGRKVAAIAGSHLKKCVLELGGSDPFIVLEDADIEYTVDMAVASRFLNCGQSCIAAKRFVLVPEVAEAFTEAFVAKVKALVVGDPREPGARLGPMARADLRETLHAQVEDAVSHGAKCLTGGAPLPGPGFYYAPTVLAGISPAMRAWREELFGPVASLVSARDEEEAIAIANDSPYGLGASLWTRDLARAKRLVARLEAGNVFVNGMVKSDPRLPFGGVKASGFGRELSHYGLKEFVNAKTVWARPVRAADR